MGFKELGLSDSIIAAVDKCGYTEPTKVQDAVIPSILQGRDVLAVAPTGRGKTAGFALPLIAILETGRVRAMLPRVLVLAPARELALQVADNFKRYSTQSSQKVVTLIGGKSMKTQIATIKESPDIIVATPGRLLDHVEAGNLMLLGLKTVVFDEADRMLDMGFRTDIEKIFSLLRSHTQKLFFSATFSKEVRKLAFTYLKDPIDIRVDPEKEQEQDNQQYFVSVSGRGSQNDVKMRYIKALIKERPDLSSCILFCNYKKDVDQVVSALEQSEISARGLYGDMNQCARVEALNSFKSSDTRVLVATDVASRGLDIPQVGHVINYDVPFATDAYIHRIGRTARAGKKGVSITLVTKGDNEGIESIRKVVNQNIEWLEVSGLKGKKKKSFESAKPDAKNKVKKNFKKVSSGEVKAGEVNSNAVCSNVKNKNTLAAKSSDVPEFEPGSRIPDFLLRPVTIVSN